VLAGVLLIPVVLVSRLAVPLGAHAMDPMADLTAVPSAVAMPLLATVAGPATITSAIRIAIALRELAEELRPIRYRLPVDGPVVRPFEPPSSEYGPGHRGVDLGVAPGTAVRAAERGVVRHAGSVAGVVWVSIDHEDGVRTSYGPLTALRVRAGDDVERGGTIGLLAPGDHGQPDVDQGLHLGARRHGVYIDPMLLPGMSGPRPTLVGSGSWWGAGHAVTPYDPWVGGRFGGVLTTPSPTASSAGFAVPPNPNHLLLVAGLASTSDIEVFDPAHLGIAPSSTSRFSYAGPGLSYGVADTWGGVDGAARRLADQLRERAAQEPGRAVDLVGHSLGGVVIAYYLLHLHDPFDVTLPPLGHVVTIASPLEGSDLARAGLAMLDAPGLGRTLSGAWDAATTLPGAIGATARSVGPDAPALADLASGSDVMVDLARAWGDALVADGTGPLATGTRVLSIVASLDGLVGADRAALDAAERRVLPGTHEGVLTSEAVRQIVWHFLAGREVVQSPGHLATFAGGTYGNALTAAAALVGDVSAALELPLPPSPRALLR
jgi:murein DD-endopeptidase MepM/ murein hydrolase activator NlpD